MRRIQGVYDSNILLLTHLEQLQEIFEACYCGVFVENKYREGSY